MNINEFYCPGYGCLIRQRCLRFDQKLSGIEPAYSPMAARCKNYIGVNDNLPECICGAPAIAYKSITNGQYYVKCGKCRTTTLAADTKKSAMIAWIVGGK